MTTECYYSQCPYHSCHDDDDGPYCYEDECHATGHELEVWEIGRQNELLSQRV